MKNDLLLNLNTNESISWPVIIASIVLLSVLIICCGVMVYLYFVRKSKRKDTSFVKSEDTVKKSKIAKLEEQLTEEIKTYRKKIASESKIDTSNIENTLKKLLTKELEQYKNQEILKINETVKQEKDSMLRKVILDSTEQVCLSIVNESASVNLDIKEGTKPRIIGKKGRSKKKFEAVTGCDLVVEKDQSVTISSPNPIRRQLAINTFNHLVKSDVFDETAIENVFNKEKKFFNEDLNTIGKEYLKKLQFDNIDPHICEYIGKLRFRTSFLQNVLSHCYECSLIARQIAHTIGIDENIAAQAAFFHDIGKSVDYEIDYDHVKQGTIIATNCHLDPRVIHAISNHHNFIDKDPYAAVVRIADVISAGRDGARVDNYDDYVKRIDHLEMLCKKVDGVVKAFAFKAGRKLRVIIDPLIYDKEKIELITYNVKQAIGHDEEVNKFSIDIDFIQTNEWKTKTKNLK